MSNSSNGGPFNTNTSHAARDNLQIGTGIILIEETTSNETNSDNNNNSNLHIKKKRKPLRLSTEEKEEENSQKKRKLEIYNNRLNDIDIPEQSNSFAFPCSVEGCAACFLSKTDLDKHLSKNIHYFGKSNVIKTNNKKKVKSKTGKIYNWIPKTGRISENIFIDHVIKNIKDLELQETLNNTNSPTEQQERRLNLLSKPEYQLLQQWFPSDFGNKSYQKNRRFTSKQYKFVEFIMTKGNSKMNSS